MKKYTCLVKGDCSQRQTFKKTKKRGTICEDIMGNKKIFKYIQNQEISIFGDGESEFKVVFSIFPYQVSQNRDRNSQKMPKKASSDF